MSNRACFTHFKQSEREEIPPALKDEFISYWYQRALNFLVRREHSPVELTLKLSQRGCPSWLCDDLIEKFIYLDYLNLERFTYSFTKNKADLGYGPIKIRYELRAHDISEELVTRVFTEIDWQAAKEKALRKIGNKAPLKIKSALYRRGFYSD